MIKHIDCKYNILNRGPRLSLYDDPENSYLVDFKIVKNDTEYGIHSIRLKGDQYYELGRSFASNWRIKVSKWENGCIIPIYENSYNPFNQVVHIYLDSKENVRTHSEWVEVIEDYRIKYNANVVVQTPYFYQLANLYDSITFVGKISNPDRCYVNFIVSKKNTGYLFPKNYHQEVLTYDYNTPIPPYSVTNKEYIKNIIFGIDYSNYFYGSQFIYPPKYVKDIFSLYI